MTLRTALRSPAILRGLVAIAAALAVMVWPELFGNLLIAFLGVVALVVGVVEFMGWLQTRDLNQLLKSLALIAFGAGLLLSGQFATRLLELILAGVIALRAAHSGYATYRSWKAEGEDPFWGAARSILTLILALALVFIPETLFNLVVITIAISWIVGGAIVLINAIGEEGGKTPNDVVGVIRSNSMAADLRRQVTETIFEGWDSRQGTLRFAALMSFATAIATFGIKADSTAVVIGAMLIAPLMSPIVALSASILMAWPKRAWYSGIRVGLGVAIGVGGAFVFSLISPDFVEITTNSQVLSRASPTTLDLLIALAAGAAGGYAVTHPAVSNSLPGVAIAVALAPPLAVVGYSLEEGAFAFAGGAFLLFLTNLVGIVVATGFTYILSGYSPWTHVERSGDQARRSLVLVGIALVLVTFPLALIGQGIIDAATSQSRAEATVEDWLGPDTTFSIARVTVTGRDVHVLILGADEPPDPNDLAQDLAESLEREILLDLNIVPETEYEISAKPTGTKDP